MEDFTKELEKYKVITLNKDGTENHLAIIKLNPKNKRYKLLLYNKENNTHYVVGYITDIETLKEKFIYV